MRSRIAAFVPIGAALVLLWITSAPPAGAVPAPWVVDPPRPQSPTELAKQIRDGDLPDEEKGRRLFPLLRKGMTIPQVMELLGDDATASWSMGPSYHYADYRIIVSFDMNESLLDRLWGSPQQPVVAPANR